MAERFLDIVRTPIRRHPLRWALGLAFLAYISGSIAQDRDYNAYAINEAAKAYSGLVASGDAAGKGIARGWDDAYTYVAGSRVVASGETARKGIVTGWDNTYTFVAETGSAVKYTSLKTLANIGKSIQEVDPDRK